MVGWARFNFTMPLHSKIFAGQTQHTCPHATIKRTVVNDKTFIETRKDINPDIRKFNSLFFLQLAYPFLFTYKCSWMQGVQATHSRFIETSNSVYQPVKLWFPFFINSLNDVFYIKIIVWSNLFFIVSVIGKLTVGESERSSKHALNNPHRPVRKGKKYFFGETRIPTVKNGYWVGSELVITYRVKRKRGRTEGCNFYANVECNQRLPATTEILTGKLRTEVHWSRFAGQKIVIFFKDTGIPEFLLV